MRSNTTEAASLAAVFDFFLKATRCISSPLLSRYPLAPPAHALRRSLLSGLAYKLLCRK